MDGYKIAVVGCAGRMGRMNLATIAADAACEIAGGVDLPDSPEMGRDIGETQNLAEQEPEVVRKLADVLKEWQSQMKPPARK